MFCSGWSTRTPSITATPKSFSSARGAEKFSGRGHTGTRSKTRVIKLGQAVTLMVTVTGESVVTATSLRTEGEVGGTSVVTLEAEEGPKMGPKGVFLILVMVVKMGVTGIEGVVTGVVTGVEAPEFSTGLKKVFEGQDYVKDFFSLL